MAQPKVINNTNKEVSNIIVKTKKYSNREQLLRLAKGIILCRKYNLLGEKLTKNKDYYRIYQMVSKTKRQLKIKGNPSTLLPFELKNIFKGIPEYIFESDSNENKIKILDKQLDMIKSISN